MLCTSSGVNKVATACRSSREWRQKEKAAVEAGKKPFYLKDSEKKKLVLEKRYEKLEAEGKLQRYMGEAAPAFISEGSQETAF